MKLQRMRMRSLASARIGCAHSVTFEELFQIAVNGYRQPRMFPVSDNEIEKNGYVYNSSLNPASHSRTLYALD